MCHISEGRKNVRRCCACDRLFRPTWQEQDFCPACKDPGVNPEVGRLLEKLAIRFP